ncbi:hypothetical protein [Oceanivirga salmonicida]|uniref:hypothetical protein n=1 Tax=Oceanivirga salmonicida TaxID=1769291 RepID=UPI000830D8D7|nr:hypothetical protein [Oceanivirga salmonicida]
MKKVLVVVLAMFTFVSCNTIGHRELSEVKQKNMGIMLDGMNRISKKLDLKNEKEKFKIEEYILYTLANISNNDEDRIQFLTETEKRIESKMEEVQRKLTLEEAKKIMFDLYINREKK